MKNIIVLLLLLITASSCKNQYSLVDKKLKKCVNNKVNNEIKEVFNIKEDVKFYTLMNAVEKLIFKKDASKQTYLNYFENTLYNIDSIKKEKLLLEIETVFNKSKFNKSHPMSRIIFYSCPFNFIKKKSNQNYTTLKLQINALNKMDEKGIDSHREILIDWLTNIDEVEFNKIIYRSPFILIIYNHLKLEAPAPAQCH